MAFSWRKRKILELCGSHIGRPITVLFLAGFLTMTATAVQGQAETQTALPSYREKIMRATGSSPNATASFGNTAADGSAIPDMALPERVEYFWHPLAHKLAATIGVEYFAATYDLKNLGGFTLGSSTKRSTITHLNLAYGITSGFALSLDFSPQGMTTVDYSLNNQPAYSLRSTGVSDLKLTALDQLGDPALSIFLGLQTNLPVTGSKLPLGTVVSGTEIDTIDGNNSSGGESLAAFLGFSHESNKRHRWGGKALYRGWFQRSSDAQDGTSTTSYGGNETNLVGYFEYHPERYYILSVLEGDFTEALYTTNSGRNTTSDPYLTGVVNVTAGYYLTQRIVMAGQLGYMMRFLSNIGSYQIGYSAPSYSVFIREEF